MAFLAFCHLYLHALDAMGQAGHGRSGGAALQVTENYPFDVAPEHIQDAVHHVLSGSGDRRRVAIEAGQGYGVLVLDQDSTLEIRVSGGRSLPSDSKLDGIARRHLIEAGLTQLRASDDFRAVVKGYQSDDIAHWAAAMGPLLKTCFGAEESEGVTVRAGVSKMPKLDDTNLCSAMRRLAKVRDWNARKSFYLLLIRSQIILLLEEPWSPGSDKPGRVRSVDTLGEGQVAAIFTSAQGVDRFDPRPVGFYAASGREVFPILDQPRIASVKINPRGTVGGELYRNEILSILEGTKRV